MGPANSQQKEETKISEQQILKEAEAFIHSNDICKKEDDCYNWIRLVLAKISLYGHKVLLEQLKQAKDRKIKMRYLELWRGITFENLDLLFQNLIKSKMTKVEQATKLTRIKTHDKYAQSEALQLQRLYERGQDLIKKQKVAVLIFVGASSTKSETLWDKQFHKPSNQQKCLFEIVMQRLQQIGQMLDFPTTYIFYDKFNSDKVNRFIKNYKYGDKLHCCMQNNHPILNLNGSVCLKSKDTGDLIQMPNGSGDFYHASIKGMSILEKLKQDKIQYVSCVNCENMLEMVIDPYLVGLFDVNKEDYDLMYKCTYPQNQNERIFKRIILEKGVPKADTIPNLTNYASSYNKHSSENMQTIRQSPVWMGHVIFSVDRVSNVLKSAESMSYFPQAVNYKVKQVSYWNPLDQKIRQNEVCYVFDKDLSDLLLNNLFKSKGIMVERQEQYAPVVTENGDYSWQQAYRHYEAKKKKQKGPFWERLKPHMMESMIRNDEFHHNRPN